MSKTRMETQDAWLWILVLLTSSVTLRKLLNSQNLCFPISEVETWQPVSKTGPQGTRPPGIQTLCHPLPHSASAHLSPDCMTKRKLTVMFWAFKVLMDSAFVLWGALCGQIRSLSFWRGHMKRWGPKTTWGEPPSHSTVPLEPWWLLPQLHLIVPPQTPWSNNEQKNLYWVVSTHTTARNNKMMV